MLHLPTCGLRQRRGYEFQPASRAGGNLRENRKPERRAVMWPKRYAKDMERAWNRVRAVPSAHIETPFGGLEYAQRGTGAPVLMSHGIWGSHAEGIGMVPTYIGDGYSSVAPSRFGYFGTALPPKAAPPTRPTRTY